MTPEAKLATALRGRHVAMIALGGVVGAGLFVGSSAAIVATGPAVVVSYALAGAIAFLVMRMLVREALKTLIQREAARRLARLGGSEPDLKVPPRRRSTPA